MRWQQYLKASIPLTRPEREVVRCWSEHRVGESRDYRRFIILTTARSGSNWLVSLLQSHPEVVVQAEAYHARSIYMCSPTGATTESKKLIARRDRHPVRFLQEYIFRSYDESVRAAGFKVFFEHLERTDRSSLVDALRGQKGLGVILLTRANLLEAYVSLEIARRTGKWLSRGSNQRDDVAIEIDVQELLTFFERRQELVSKYRKLFDGCPLLDVSYEEMLEDIDGITVRVEEFLGVSACRLQTPFVKQGSVPLARRVSNLGEVRSVLTEKGFGWMCEDA